MPALLPDVDPDGLLEYSVVYTDRALNHMSASFQAVMNDVSTTLKRAYGAAATVVVPGSGTFGMEAVARQFATGKRCLVIRNGWFSYRWTQIFEAGDIPASSTVLMARPVSDEPQAPFVPAPIDEVVVTNTLPVPEDMRQLDNLTTLSIAPMVADTLMAIFKDKSVSSIFMGENV